MFDWLDYLTLARALVAHDQPAGASAESRLRCAASRAYYAVLNRAAGHLRDVGEDLPKDASYHDAVIDHFRECREHEWRRVGDWLEKLRENRRKADYEEQEGNWSKKAEKSLVLSHQAIQALEAGIESLRQVFGDPDSA
jgi:uncharacterized protein (UPF0332 family)